MKRGSWTPTKHHFLCSDHFTPDSFDVRWGIRYLKQNAVPTIFSVSRNVEESDCFSRKTKKTKTEAEDNKRTHADMCVDWKACGQIVNLHSIANLATKAGMTDAITAEDFALTTEKPITLGLPDRDTVFQLNPSMDTDPITLKEFTENLVTVTIEGERSNVLDSEIDIESANSDSSSERLLSVDRSSATLSRDIKPAQVNVDAQTVEQLVSTKESFITILLPVACSQDPSLATNSLVCSDQQILRVENAEFDDANDVDSDTEVLTIEHSYCRQDFDREDMWRKIVKLNSKIAFLEGQESNTLSRLRSLEALIGKLKEENLLSEEKLKIVEDCFTTYEVTMI
ncbi:THAP domain-containing protein 5 isoform X2 [Ambystoma mexicanum]